MRARYAAYALGKTRFVQETTAEPPVDRAAWTAEIERFTASVRFVSLEILSQQPGEREAWVTFRAGLLADGADVGFAERSRFVRRDRWLYADGERLG